MVARLWFIIFFAACSGPTIAEECSIARQSFDLLELPKEQRRATEAFIAEMRLYRKLLIKQQKRLKGAPIVVEKDEIARVAEASTKALLEVLEVFDIKFQRYQTKIGLKFKILPDRNSALGRLADRLWAKSRTSLVVPPLAHYLESVSSAYFTSSPLEIGLSLASIVRFHPKSGRVYSMFRLTEAELHELRHWHYTMAPHKVPGRVRGEMMPVKGRLANYGTYSDYLSFEEFHTHPYEQYARFRVLRKMKPLFESVAKGQQRDLRPARDELEYLMTSAFYLSKNVQHHVTGAARDFGELAEALVQVRDLPLVPVEQWSNYVVFSGGSAGLNIHLEKQGKTRNVYLYHKNYYAQFSDVPAGFAGHFDTAMWQSSSQAAKARSVKALIDVYVPRLKHLQDISVVQQAGIERLNGLANQIVGDKTSSRQNAERFLEMLSIMERMVAVPIYGEPG